MVAVVVVAAARGREIRGAITTTVARATTARRCLRLRLWISLISQNLVQLLLALAEFWSSYFQFIRLEDNLFSDASKTNGFRIISVEDNLFLAY